MTMITPSYLGETIEYSSLHACRSTLEDPTDDDGQLVMRSDVYGLDSRVLALIRTERGMIDVATKERDRDSANNATASARRPVKPPPQPQSGGFFQALFGGGQPPPVGRPPNRIR